MLNIYVFISNNYNRLEAKDVNPRDARLKTIVLHFRAPSRYLEKRPALAMIGRAFLRRVFVPLRLSLTSVTRSRAVKLKADGAARTANRNLLSRFREPKSGKGHLAARKCVVPTTTRGQMVHQ